MKELKLENAVIFGVSQGGMIAQSLAINHPELVSKLILGSTTSRIDEASKERLCGWLKYAENNSPAELCKSFINDVYSEAYVKKFGKIIIAFHKNCSDEEIERFILTAKACEGFDVLSELKNIKCPSLVIGAENDRIFDTNCFKETAQELGSELYIYPAPYGHAVYDEAPDYKEKMLKFLNK